MKSIALTGINNPEHIESLLNQLLPRQGNPWIISSDCGDPIAYVNYEPKSSEWNSPCVIADISGRHFDKEDIVTEFLMKLKIAIGGLIEPDK